VPYRQDSTSLTSSNRSSPANRFRHRLLPRIRLRTRKAPSLLNQKILVAIDKWDPTSRYPEGHLVRALGGVESKEAEQESLLLEFEVPYRPFGTAILTACLKKGILGPFRPRPRARKCGKTEKI